MPNGLTILGFIQQQQAAAQPKPTATGGQSTGSRQQTPVAVRPPSGGTPQQAAQTGLAYSIVAFVNNQIAADRAAHAQQVAQQKQTQQNVGGAHGGMSIIDFLQPQQQAVSQPTVGGLNPLTGMAQGLNYQQQGVYTPGAFMQDPFGRAVGIDISQYENTWNPQQSRVPLDFAILRASAGTTPDTSFMDKNQTLQGSGIPVKGAYHFLEDSSSVSSQVGTFLNQVSGKPYDFYAVDYEANIGMHTNPQTAQMARDFLYQVSQITGKPTLLYTNQSTLTQFFNKPGDQNIPVWISWPDNGPNVFAPNKYVTGGKTAPIWQYTYQAPADQFGINVAEPWMMKPRFYQGKWLQPLSKQGIDVNVFNGSVSQMQNFLQQVGKQQQALYGGH